MFGKTNDIKDILPLMLPNKNIILKLIGCEYETVNNNNPEEKDKTYVAEQEICFKIDTIIFMPNRENLKTIIIRPENPIQVHDGSHLSYRTIIEFPKSSEKEFDFDDEIKLGRIELINKYVYQTDVKLSEIEIDNISLILSRY